MATSPAIAIALAGLAATVIGAMVSSLVTLIGVLLIGVAVIALAAELEARIPQQVKPMPRLLYTCPACRADVHTDQRACPKCGQALPVYQPSSK